MSVLILSLVGHLAACTKPPVYNSIKGITVHEQTGTSGTNRTELTGEQLLAAANCLYSTAEIPQEESDEAFLNGMILLEVKDRLGDRMFELYTKQNFKGNHGKYYRNSCIYKIIQ